MKGLIEKDVKPSSMMRILIGLITIGLVLIYTFKDSLTIQLFNKVQLDDSICPIHPIVAPSSFYKDNSTVLKILNDEKFMLESVKKLSGAVQIDTQVFDKPPVVDEDPEYWLKFKKFHEYIEKTFPIVFENLEIVKINTYGIVIYWKGSDESLKPVMLTAHQDVVPIQKATLPDWSYPPLEGHFDGEYLYGRGSSDCKNVLIAILETFELLLKQNYKPSRGMIGAFGFDEEVSGMKGAQEISKYLQSRFGPNSIYSILDEGTNISKEPNTGLIVAGPSITEKGYITINAKLKTKGGHSSLPPDHTSIGIVSELVYLLEENPFKPSLTAKNPTLEFLQCLAKHGSEKFPPNLVKSIFEAGYDKVANLEVIKFILSLNNTMLRYFITTSQAVDIIRGGEKENALPEVTEITVNHRISVDSSVKETVDRFIYHVKTVAKKHNLSVKLDGESIIDEEDTVGSFEVVKNPGILEPAPVAPTTGKIWEYLAGVSRHLIEDLVLTKEEIQYPTIMSPLLMPANTDTRYYHNLTTSVFRYTPAYDADPMHNAHSVDEFIPYKSHLQLVAFFYEYLQAVDTADAGN